MEWAPIGVIRTKYYKDLPDTVKERNVVRRRLEAIAGGRRAVSALHPAIRNQLRKEALELHRTSPFIVVRPPRNTLPFIDKQPKYSERSKHGYVYVLVNNAWPQYVKVGCAGDLNKRLAQFNTGSPWRDYEIRHYVYADDRRKAEARVHELLKEFRAAGEWFSTRLQEAVECLEEVSEFDPRGFNE